MGKMTIGIIGAGKLGITLAQLAVRAGYDVHIAGSGDPRDIELAVNTLSPGAVAVSSAEAAVQSQAIVLALPLSKFRQLPKQELAGKLIIDATNYWWEVDGPRNDILPDDQSTSEAIQEFLVNSRVIKTFSHMGYHHLHDEASPKGTSTRKALAVAGDNKEDIEAASRIVDDLGFDPIYVGSLAIGRNLEPGSPAFGARVSKDELLRLIQPKDK